MAAPKGNKFWLLRSSHGQKPVFTNPDDLREAAYEYFNSVDENPLKEQKMSQSKGKLVKRTIPKMQAMTIQGLRIFLGISKDTWFGYKDQEGFKDVSQEIEDIIWTQKFCGAAAGFLNANLISKDLGLVDHTETTIKGHLGLTDLTDDELNAKLKALEDAESKQSADD